MYTWKAPGDGARYQLDYIIVKECNRIKYCKSLDSIFNKQLRQRTVITNVILFSKLCDVKLNRYRNVIRQSTVVNVVVVVVIVVVNLRLL